MSTCPHYIANTSDQENDRQELEYLIAVNRSDRKASRFLINMHSTKTEMQIIATAPGSKSLVKRS